MVAGCIPCHLYLIRYFLIMETSNKQTIAVARPVDSERAFPALRNWAEKHGTIDYSTIPPEWYLQTDPVKFIKCMGSETVRKLVITNPESADECSILLDGDHILSSPDQRKIFFLNLSVLMWAHGEYYDIEVLNELGHTIL